MMATDLARLLQLVEPFTVRLLRSRTGAAGTAGTTVAEPIFIPARGYDGLEDWNGIPGTNWSRDEIAQLETWTREWYGGGVYVAAVVDAAGHALEWKFGHAGSPKSPTRPPHLAAHANREDTALPAWTFEADGWMWLHLFGVSVQICHAAHPQQRMWIAHLYCGRMVDDRREVLVDNGGRGYAMEDEAKRAALEYIIPRLQRDLVAIDGLLEILPPAATD